MLERHANLGCARLRRITLSEAGHQWMSVDNKLEVLALFETFVIAQHIHHRVVLTWSYFRELPYLIVEVLC